MVNKRILLVSANQFAVPYPVYPIGVSYLYSYLSSNLPEFEIRIFDFNLQNIGEFKALLADFQPDYTGISLRNIDDVDSYHQMFFVNGYKNIVDAVKETIETCIIVGGSAFSIFPEHLFRFFEPDFGIYGEGEESLYKLILSLENKEDLSFVPGLVYRRDEHLIVNVRKQFIKAPDLSFEDDLIDFYWKKSGMMNVQTKRGCPHKCIYCTYPLIEGTNVRTLNVDKVIETLTDLRFNKKIDYIFFTDSVFNLNRNYNRILAEKMLERKLGIKWGAYFSPHDLDQESLELYQRAGLTHIEFGTESLSDSTLAHYGKHFTVDEVVRVSEICRSLDIYYSHFLILGGYGETEDSINESFENSKRFRDTVFFPFVGMRIYPGTRLHSLAIADGTIHPEDDLLDPAYYLAPDIDYASLKARAELTNRRWVFPDEDVITAMNRMRMRNRKGMLWHHLRK